MACKELFKLLSTMADDSQRQPDEKLPEVAGKLAKYVCSPAEVPRLPLIAWEVWSDLGIRSGLLKLIAYAARHLTRRHKATWLRWYTALLVVVRMLQQGLSNRRPGPAVLPVQIELVRLIVQTDLLPCLSHLLASLPDAQDATATEQPLLDEHGIAYQVTYLVGALVTLASSDHRAAFARHGLTGALLSSRLLEFTARAAILGASSSSAAAPPPPAARAAPEAGPSDSADLDKLRTLLSCLRDLTICRALPDGPSTREVIPGVRVGPTSQWAIDMLSGHSFQHLMLLHLLTQLCAADGGSRYGLPHVVQMPVLYIDPRDPTGVCQDPFAARRSANAAGSPDVSAPGRGGSCSSGGSGAAGAAAPGDGNGSWLPDLFTFSLINTVDFWVYSLMARGVQRPPVSNAAVRVLCARLASAASDVLEEELERRRPEVAARLLHRGRRELRRLPLLPGAARGGGGAAGGLAAAGGDPGGAGDRARGARRGRFHLPDCRFLATRSLTCAMVTFTDAEYAGSSRLWAPAVRAVDVLLELEDRTELAASLASELSELLRPRFPAVPVDLALASHPTPQVAAALAAGYIPCLEKLLRRAYGTPGLAAAAQGIQAVNDHFAPFISIAGLLMHGDLREAASLLATGAKLLRRAGSELERLPALGADARAGALLDCGGVLAGLRSFAGRGSLMDVRLWWELVREEWGEAREGVPGEFWWQSGAGQRRPQQDATAAGAGPSTTPGSVGSTGLATRGCAGADAGSSDPGSAGSSGARATPPDMTSFPTPVTQLLALTTFIWSKWLPATARAALACQPAVYTRELNAVVSSSPDLYPAGQLIDITFRCVPIVCAAHLACAERAAAGDRHGAQAAASWRRLLLDTDPLGAVRCMLYDLAQLWNTRCGIGERAGMMVAVLASLALTLPRETGLFLNAPLPTAGPPPLPRALAGQPARQVVRCVLGPEGGQKHERILQIIEGVCAGSVGALSDSAAQALKGVVGVHGWLAKRLPPPCVVMAAAGLPVCGNERCESLECDSEGGLELSRCAGRCAGAVSYCGRDCQMAHWKAGHKKECGKKECGKKECGKKTVG